MINFHIPGFGDLTIHHLVLDYNGTIAVDGKVVQGVREILTQLSQHLTIHVVTANTFGDVEEQLKGVPCKLSLLLPKNQDLEKEKLVESLNPATVISIGNGRNDARMLQRAVIGIAVIQKEGAAGEALRHADVVCTDILSALELVTHPLRLTATLRN
jgi:soluble P-type ATPase